MRFNSFLGRLEESSSKRTLNEQDKGMSGEELKQSLGDKWAYVPEKEYGGFKPVVVEEGNDQWTIYYLDKVGSSAAGDEEDWGDVDAFASQKKESTDEERLRRFFENGMKPLSEEIEGDKSADLSEYIVQRKESGDFATILEKCVNLVEKG